LDLFVLPRFDLILEAGFLFVFFTKLFQPFGTSNPLGGRLKAILELLAISCQSLAFF
jgi:hypothetical protein